jgi:hypothetical protein
VKYFLCFSKLYRCNAEFYKILLTFVQQNKPFNLKDFKEVECVGVIGVDIGRISREDAGKELKKC